jgi:hypothetical protein
MKKIFLLILILLLVVYHKGVSKITSFYGSGLNNTIKFLQGRENQKWVNFLTMRLSLFSY